MDKISAYLETDHTRCDSLYLQVLTSVAERDWPQASAHLERFAQALQRHFTMEETVVFSAFETATGSTHGHTESLRHEHCQLNAILLRLAAAISQRHVSAVTNHANTFRMLLWQHSLKEDGILYPLADRVLHGQQDELISAMRALDGADAAVAD
jgi:hemerythrin-like domain-containing protein